MRKKGKIQPDKILWRVISDGSPRLQETYDLAVAYLEGGSTYYVAEHVKAKRKQHLYTLIMKVRDIQRQWTETVTIRLTGFLPYQMR